MLVNEERGHSYIEFSNSYSKESILAKLQTEILRNLFSSDEGNESYNGALGASVENDHVVAGLIEASRDSEKVEIIENSKVKSMVVGNSKSLTEIELENGDRFKA